MYKIKIPSNTNKLNFALDFLKKLRTKFENYTFINCTISPIEEYSYIKCNDVYYREIKNQNYPLIERKKYIEAYKKDSLCNQGISIEKYIEMNLLFELEKIIVVSKKNKTFDETLSLVTIDICPDGYDEIYLSGNDNLLLEMITYLENINMLIIR